MSKIVRLNNETLRLMKLTKEYLKEEFEKDNVLRSMSDILDNDNMIIQSGLRTGLEYYTMLLTKSK